MSDIRVHLHIFGIVQGVAFRYSTRREAMRLKLTGWVRNVPDGSVEALVEGDEIMVDRLIQWCEHGPPGAKVDRVEVERSDSTGAFSRFDITY